MDNTSFEKKNGKYYLKYSAAESYYKNGLLLECIQHFKSLFKGRLLDLGCGNKPYADIYNEVCESSVGCDVPFSIHQNSHVEILCSAEDIDKYFEPASFDCILCTEVLEHTSDDSKVMENVNMLLKNNGTLILSAPFIYVLHEAPYDHRRYTYYGLQNILESNSFKIQSAFSMGATFSSGFLVFYYSLTKIFYYTFKKAGLKNLSSSKVVRSVLNFPEYIFYRLSINSFRKKLSENKFPSINEKFSSPGYFIIAKKIIEK
ncbi:MAG: class I SAM-dependent methyltransferase [Bacteroidota bacterium]|nr:class I SAM-dependent methyltransferase [Bacteroidota bacterium]